jgi:uncharacterized membrane protein YfcA
MTVLFGLTLVLTGFIVGVLAGILGLGGGVFLVPILVAFGFSPLSAVATSSVPVFVSSVSGVAAHMRSGEFKIARSLRIGLVAAIAAQGGVQIAHLIHNKLLLSLFAVFLVSNIWLMRIRKNIQNQAQPTKSSPPPFGDFIIGVIGGTFSGLFGVGGGVIMVPLLVLLQKEPLKMAVRTSMAVVLVSAISSCVGHAFKGSVLWDVGSFLAIGSLVGAQLGVGILPKIPEQVVRKIFIFMLTLLALYVVFKAATSPQS